MSDRVADVIVVGGGPAGAATAALLARRGIDVLLLDQAAFPRAKACAEYLSPGVIDVLSRLGVLAALKRAGGAWLLGMRVCGQREECWLRYPAVPVSGEPRLALGIQRRVFDQILLDHARRLGARACERSRVSAALVEQGRVVGVRLHRPAGEAECRARLVIAADGLHSTVAQSLGLCRPVRWPRRLGLVAHFTGVSGLDRFGEMHVGRGFYCGVAPVGGGLVSVGLATSWGSKPQGEPAARFFERRLAKLPGVMRLLEGARRVSPVRGVGPMARRVSRVAGPGYLLVGDAAGFLDPFIGEGIFRALRGAELAAEAAAQALAGQDDYAADYARARRAAFADKERLSWLVQAVLALPLLFEHVLGRLARQPWLAIRLSGVLGDCQPAGSVLQPGFLWSLLSP